MHRLQVYLLVVLCGSLMVSPVAEAALGNSPNDAERRALAQLKGTLVGQIVWESNRTGVWELYTMNADGTGARRLTSLAKPGDPTAYGSYLRPRLSPDGKTVLFAYGKHGAAPEVWLVPASGGGARKLTRGNPLNWAAGGKEVLFVRDSHVWRHELATGDESLVHPVKVPAGGLKASMVGAVRADLKAGVFRTKKNEYFVFDEGKTVKTTGGCEPGFSADGRYMYWVQGPKDFRVWDIANDKEHQLLGTPAVEPYNYTYCPTVSADSRWLLYGASPGEHSHSTSDYEIYLQELNDWQPVGKPVRLSFNRRTDRWASIFVAPPGSRNPLPEGPYDVAGNTLTNPPPPPLAIFTFPKQDAKPDWGGDWGLWPQVERCMGTATFVPGEDAEGGAGGSTRIEYTIEGEPRTFSMWFAPGRTMDLSAYDRFVMYARGEVPSFTIVVKDATSDEAGETETGIADYVVTGLTAKWRRFELPLSSFIPREQGGSIDWGSINHVGVALMTPYNALSGSLQVDNLRALPAGVE